MATATYADDIEEEETFPCAVPQNQESSGLSRSPCDVCALPVTLPVSVGGVASTIFFLCSSSSL